MNADIKLNISSAKNLHFNSEANPNSISFTKPLNLSFSRHNIKAQKASKDEELTKLITKLS